MDEGLLGHCLLYFHHGPIPAFEVLNFLLCLLPFRFQILLRLLIARNHCLEVLVEKLLFRIDRLRFHSDILRLLLNDCIFRLLLNGYIHRLLLLAPCLLSWLLVAACLVFVDANAFEPPFTVPALDSGGFYSNRKG